MKRYTTKLGTGVGLVSLVALNAGLSMPACAQVDETPTGRSFELAMLAADTPRDGYSKSDKSDAPITARDTFAKPTTAPAASPTAPGDDGLPEGGAYVQADQIQTVNDSNDMVAKGHVEMRYKDRLVRADQVTYNSDARTTVAEGHTQTIADDGTVQFSDKITYNDDMESGISENFAGISKDGTKVFARRVEHFDENTTRLTNVVYTPCELCVKDGVTRDPSWSISASEITQRKDKKMVFYDNATFRLNGVPVLYMPYMWTPDPELDRASGFLQPKIGYTNKRGGFTYEQPYLWSISPYTALIISPQINQGINPLLNMQFQRHFYSGLLNVRFGFTNESFFENDGTRVGPADTRDYLLADGDFKIDDHWRWSFTAQHVKDLYVDPVSHKELDNANFFERYAVDDPFQRVGEWVSDSRELVNQIHLTRQDSNAYMSLSFADFQSLAVDLTNPANTTNHPIAFDSNLYPTVGPMLEAYWSPKVRLLGGQMTFSANGLYLSHKLYNSAGAPAFFQANAPSPYDTARLSLGASWYGNMTTASGVRWGPFVDLRHDEYRESQLDANEREEKVSRDLGTAGFNISYPLVRRFDKFSAVIEPVFQYAVSPDAQTSPFLPTEDSQSLEFDATTLFAVNKSPGFDIYEGGARANVGVRSELNFDSGLKVSGLVGRTLRNKPEAQFLKTITSGTTTYSYDPSGLGNKSSDWVVDGSFDTSKGVYGYVRLRLDSEATRISQGEWGLSAFSPRTEATVRYIFNDILATPIVVNGKLQRFGDNYRNIQLYARHFITKNWGVSARLDRDLVSNTWRRSTVSAIYRNDCIWYELVYQRDETDLYTHNGKPRSSILLRLNFPTLSQSSSDFTDVR
jgi:LPS-assembly protein